MSVAHYTANSLSEFVAQICEIKASLRKDGFRFNEIPLFRGHSDNSYKLIPAIARPIESFSNFKFVAFKNDNFTISSGVIVFRATSKIECNQSIFGYV